MAPSSYVPSSGTKWMIDLLLAREDQVRVCRENERLLFKCEHVCLLQEALRLRLGFSFVP